MVSSSSAAAAAACPGGGGLCGSVRCVRQHAHQGHRLHLALRARGDALAGDRRLRVGCPLPLHERRRQGRRRGRGGGGRTGGAGARRELRRRRGRRVERAGLGRAERRRRGAQPLAALAEAAIWRGAVLARAAGVHARCGGGARRGGHHRGDPQRDGLRRLPRRSQLHARRLGDRGGEGARLLRAASRPPPAAAAPRHAPHDRPGRLDAQRRGASIRRPAGRGRRARGDGGAWAEPRAAPADDGGGGAAVRRLCRQGDGVVHAQVHV
mmetsp:Transcript_35610/g.114884  ORF Transcript_35610/g.114884 Transcript_35610/m.114884 type:complete len:267 (+) Transcript_35610:306-1106(+)